MADKNPFPPGISTNPGGRPKSTPEMIAARVNARAAAPRMVSILVSIADSEEADPTARIKACVAVLDRALGKPEQAITGADGGPIVTNSSDAGMVAALVAAAKEFRKPK